MTFRFEGRSYDGYEGDVLSSALWANGVRLLGRSFKYHRPRGVFSMAGWDANVMVEDGERTNLRGDLLPIEPGLDVRAVNTQGGLARDRMRFAEWGSRFMPVGFYYKTFHRPKHWFPFFEKQLRQVAGLGRVNSKAPWRPTPKDYAFCDVAVIGAGPAGLSAALAAADQGLQVMLIDEQPRIGGSFHWQWAADSTAQQTRDDLISKVTEHEKIEIRGSTQVGSWDTDHWLALFSKTHLTKLRAKSVIVATGCFEQPAVFRQNDLPGVMLGSAALRLMHQYAVKPFERGIILAGNAEAYRLALTLHEHGIGVDAIADLRPEGEPSELASRAADAGITLHNNYAVYEAVSKQPSRGVTGAVLCPLDQASKANTDAAKYLACDGIAVSVGWMPAGGIFYQAGGRFTYCDAREQLVPNTEPEGVFAVGRMNGFFELDSQLTDGRRGALAAAAFLGAASEPVPDVPTHTGPPLSHPYPIIEHPHKKNFVELDEDLHLVDFKNAHQEGFDSIELIKRYSTVGMGPTQGKLANMNTVRILSRLNDRPINETGTTTFRPFHMPVPIEQLAGRRFHPMRHTPMHDWHKRNAAEMFHAGSWYRPEYYRSSGNDRDESIFNEAMNVRENVGVVDVSTLGKHRIAGPDAVEFLHRIYTGRFAKQQVGRMRYGLACDETGVIIEDGVVARLADDVFYVTSTSSGAAAFFRSMQRWALIWNMDVSLTDQTSRLAAMNIAGPKSREILAQLTDMDLSAEAFEYLGVREGIVAGAPAMLMRVGFVGELGYEIHVPASYGLHVWRSLMEAGASVEIKPFGVEAQRLLRLEKGHIIVSQDTDALTNPYEADCAWAIGKNKPFFVGQRSLDVALKQGITRKLVGIRFDKDETKLPEECNLIFNDGQIIGRVTSIAKRSTVGHPLGLVFVTPDLAEHGTKLAVRLDGGEEVAATVAPMTAYDPEGERQKM
jgi:sarcosine oxidase subunit alpha